MIQRDRLDHSKYCHCLRLSNKLLQIHKKRQTMEMRNGMEYHDRIISRNEHITIRSLIDNPK